LDPKARFCDLSLLAHTGAGKMGDSFGITETFEGFDRPFRHIFDVVGYRHDRHNVPDLSLGEMVNIRTDPDNDRRAAARKR